jgi:hypothetical protein
VADVFEPSEAVEVGARFRGADPEPLEAVLMDESGRVVLQRRLEERDGSFGTGFGLLAPGAYTVTVRGYGSKRAAVSPVTAPIIVWDAN